MFRMRKSRSVRPQREPLEQKNQQDLAPERKKGQSPGKQQGDEKVCMHPVPQIGQSAEGGIIIPPMRDDLHAPLLRTVFPPFHIIII